MPSHWLVKSEPDAYSLDELRRDGTTAWSDVRNFAARNHLRAMRKGDLAFVYHSNAEPSAIVGVAEVVREAYPDPTQFDPKAGMGYDASSSRADPKWSAVDLRFREALTRPVTLHEVKATPALAEMALVRVSRLSVQPVTAAEWKAVLRLASSAPPGTARRARPSAPTTRRARRR